jgi:hypothetical protein
VKLCGSAGARVGGRSQRKEPRRGDARIANRSGGFGRARGGWEGQRRPRRRWMGRPAAATQEVEPRRPEAGGIRALGTYLEAAEFAKSLSGFRMRVEFTEGRCQRLGGRDAGKEQSCGTDVD